MLTVLDILYPLINNDTGAAVIRIACMMKESPEKIPEFLRARIRALDHRNGELHEAIEALEQLLAEKAAQLERVESEMRALQAEQIRLETAARLGRERYRTLVDNIPCAVYQCVNDASWTMEFVSERIEDITGYPQSDFVNNAVRTFTSVIHPDDVFHVINILQRGLERRQPYEIEYRILHADGSVRRVYEKGRGVYSVDGAFLWLDGVIFDVTESQSMTTGRSCA